MCMLIGAAEFAVIMAEVLGLSWLAWRKQSILDAFMARCKKPGGVQDLWPETRLQEQLFHGSVAGHRFLFTVRVDCGGGVWGLELNWRGRKFEEEAGGGPLAEIHRELKKLAGQKRKGLRR